MTDYVLVSGIGLSDPTRGNFDGAFLHILRHFKPKKAYLFMTSEVCTFDDKDNRYEVMAQKLCHHLGVNCDIIKLKYPNITDPHLFGFFNKEFESIISKIRTENPQSKILVNLSSGTPQMKESFHLICAVSPYKLFPVQVTAPYGEGNRSKPVGMDYNIDEEWDNLIDNHTELNPPNRSSLVELENVTFLFSRELIKGSLSAYDYNGALAVAKSIKELIPSEVLILLEATFLRTSLNLSMADKLAKEVNFSLFPVQTEPAKTIFEYILSLKLRVSRREYADFIRAISPVLSDLFEQYAEQQLNIRIKDSLCNRNYKGIWMLSKEKLISSGLYNDYIRAMNIREYEDKALCAANILPLILIKSQDRTVVEYASNLRQIEANVRNLVAHEIVSLDDDGIKRLTGHSSNQIIKYLTFIFAKTFPGMCKEKMWDSYNQLNSEILDRLYSK